MFGRARLRQSSVSPLRDRRVGRREAIAALIGAAGAGFLTWQFLPPSGGSVRRFLMARPEYLADNPELIEAGVTVVQSRAFAGQARERKAMIAGKWESLVHPAFAPCLGPIDGSLGLIEFTDYLCAPCRGSTGPIHRALAAYPERNVILIFVPVSGALSNYAANFAAACYFIDPAAFARLHVSLMEGVMPDQKRIEESAEAQGYSIDDVVAKMETPNVRNYLVSARRFAEELGLKGVPAFLNPEGRLQVGGISEKQAIVMMRGDD